MKILSIVVTYYPEKTLLERNVNAFIDDVEKVLVWENTPDHEKEQYRFLFGDKIEYCGDGINSISKALNYGWQYAKREGYDYLLTMDQDSVFDNFKTYKKHVEEHPLIFNAIYSPLIWAEGRDTSHNTSKIVDWAITSGMLIPISVLNRIGGYDERFAVDGIDIDLCLKAKRFDIPTLQFSDIILFHRFGNPIESSIAGHTKLSNNYPSSRLYSIYLSQAILLRRYNSKSLVKNFCRAYLYKTPKNILLFEKDKAKKLALSFKGLMIGLFCKK